MTDLEFVKRFFDGDGFVKLAGIEIREVNDEKAVVKAKIGAEHRNAWGAVQGGMLYTLADLAFAVLGNHLHPVTITQVGQISYIKAAMTEEITATATETAKSGRTTISQVIIRDQKGETVCVATFNGFIKDADKEEMKKRYESEK